MLEISRREYDKMSYLEQLRLNVSMSSGCGEMRVPLQIKVTPIDVNELANANRQKGTGAATCVPSTSVVASLQAS